MNFFFLVKKFHAPKASDVILFSPILKAHSGDSIVNQPRIAFVFRQLTNCHQTFVKVL